VVKMVEYFLSKIPVLWGSIDTAPATFVCTDSNQGSWAAVFLIPIKKTEVLSEGKENADSEVITAPNGLNFGTILDAAEKELPELGRNAKEWTLVPVKWDGDKWPKSIQEKSSTWRERLAAIESVDRGRGHLRGRCVVVCDNANVSKAWRDVAERLTAGYIAKWENFNSQLWKSIQVFRKDPTILLVSAIARKLEDEKQKDKRNKAAKQTDAAMDNPARKRSESRSSITSENEGSTIRQKGLMTRARFRQQGRLPKKIARIDEENDSEDDRIGVEDLP
jgi:hypothetical protein